MEEGNSNNQHEREEDDHDYQERGGGGGGSTVGGARWNPTKEQIGILERMYSEGIRTPSADQIQQITARLRVYGHIEGKNVFYWFQNHKARQRQKLRQERLAAAAASGATTNLIVNPHFLGPSHHHFNPNPNPNTNPSISNVNLNPRTIFPAPPQHPSYNPHHHHPHYHISPNHVICSSYYLPQTNPGFYTPPHPHHHYSAPAAADHPRSSKHGINTTTTDQMPRGGNTGSSANDHHHIQVQGSEYMGVRTLDLFPVHPTGILEHKLGGGSSSNNNNSGDQNNNNSSSKTCSSEETHTTNYDNGDHNMQQRIFDFFSRGHASSESH